MHQDALVHDSASRSVMLAPASAGVPTLAQAVPFQRCVSALLPRRLPSYFPLPAAMHAPPRTQDTSFMVATVFALASGRPIIQVETPPLSVGVATLAQAVPFQCSVSVPPPVPEGPPVPCGRIQTPIAQQSALVAQDTVPSVLDPRMLGLSTTDQRFPFQHSIKVAKGPGPVRGPRPA